MKWCVQESEWGGGVVQVEGMHYYTKITAIGRSILIQNLFC